MSEDPIGFDSGDVNLYRYVENNPVEYIDPFGFSQKDIQDAMIYVAAHSGMQPAGTSAILNGGSTGLAIPPLNHILISSEYSAENLTEDKKRQLLQTIFHELTHNKDGLVKTIGNSKGDHDKIRLDAYNFSLKHRNEFSRRQENNECLIKP